MRRGRLALELTVLSALSTALVHAIPEGYGVRQTYSMTGAEREQENLALRLTERIRELLLAQGRALPRRSLRCEREERAARVSCEIHLGRRGEAIALSTFLREEIPPRIGWIPTESLKIRIRETLAKQALWVEEMASLERELATLAPDVTESTRKIEKLRPERERIEREIFNKKRQLEILDEGGSSSSDRSIRERFQAKRNEVSALLATLGTDLNQVDQELLELSAPSERKEKIEAALPPLRAQIDLARAQVDSWTPLLGTAKGKEFVADPEGFQVAALGEGSGVIPLRSWEHLLWSFPLGLLLLAFLRRESLAFWKDCYFRTPEEVVSATDLPYLGPL